MIMWLIDLCLTLPLNFPGLRLFFLGSKVMESLEHAMARGASIIAEYLGGSITCDAHRMTDPRADGLGISSCITQSLRDAGVSPEEVILYIIFFTQKIKGEVYGTPCIRCSIVLSCR